MCAAAHSAIASATSSTERSRSSTVGDWWATISSSALGIRSRVANLGRASATALPGVCFFLILAPTSSFLPIADPIFEHRMYLPLAAILKTERGDIQIAFERNDVGVAVENFVTLARKGFFNGLLVHRVGHCSSSGVPRAGSAGSAADFARSSANGRFFSYSAWTVATRLMLSPSRTGSLGSLSSRRSIPCR